jgi:hypothetical protein
MLETEGQLSNVTARVKLPRRLITRPASQPFEKNTIETSERGWQNE